MKIIVRRALFSDIEGIYKILKPYSDDGVILERSKEDIARTLENFFVALNKEEIAGTISYHDYGNKLKEVRSLAVISDYFRMGIGAALLKTLVDSLINRFPEVNIFTLSYYPEFFEKCGFLQIPRDYLPEKIWKDCQNCKKRENCGETALILTKKSLQLSKSNEKVN